MEQVVSESEASRRFNTVLISSFAFAAVLLAVLGIYSVIAFSVASRLQEMAIRMTLGSQRSAIVRLVIESGANSRYRLRHWIGRRRSGFGAFEIDAVWREPVRSAGADACGDWRAGVGCCGIRVAGVARGVDRSDAGVERRVAFSSANPEDPDLASETSGSIILSLRSGGRSLTPDNAASACYSLLHAPGRRRRN